RIDLERQFFDLGPLVFGFGLGRRRDGVDEVGDLDLIGIAATTRDLVLERGIVALAHLDIRIDDEDHLTPARAKKLAAAARSGLDDHRMALRRARHREWPAGAEIPAGIIEAMHRSQEHTSE